MAQPMVGGIYTADPETLSLRATMPRFLEMERDHRSLIRAMWKAGAAGGRRTRAHGRGTSGARYSLFLSLRRRDAGAHRRARRASAPKTPCV